MDISTAPKSSFTHLEGLFLKLPFPDSSPAVTNDEKVVELDIGSVQPLNIFFFFVFVCSLLTVCIYSGTDDIEIDETPSLEATSSHEVAPMRKGKFDFPFIISL